MTIFTLNYPAIPVLSVGFTRSHPFMGRSIQAVRGGLYDPAFPNHAFLVSIDRGQKFATEKTIHGLQQMSMDQYRTQRNRIVCMYYWTGWDDQARRNEALDYLAYLRRKQGDQFVQTGKYDHIGLLSFIFPKLVKPHPEREWCSENAASIHKRFGAGWVGKTEISPDQLLTAMQNSMECIAVLNYYVY